MNPPLRVAFFADSFQEANGVGTLSREFVAFARGRKLPFLTVHGGPQTRVEQSESLTTIELKRGIASFPLDHDLYCDPLLNRYKPQVTNQVRAFAPDVIHITGPSDMGILGFWVAHTLGVPLVASWHTNLHEYAGRRLDKAFSLLSERWRGKISDTAEAQSLRACVRFYRLAKFILAPNEPTLNLLRARTGKPGFLMPHGVDTQKYSPANRRRIGGPFRIGYVGRFSPEKNVRVFGELDRRLREAGAHSYQLVLIGAGSETDWLRSKLPEADLPGILRGDALAQAFADMDAFVFPSRTDTFGLVLLEAMASGVPVIASRETGMHVGIRDGIEGFHANDIDSLTGALLRLMHEPGLRIEMGCAARAFAESMDWREVFTRIYDVYEQGLEETGTSRRAAQRQTV